MEKNQYKNLSKQTLVKSNVLNYNDDYSIIASVHLLFHTSAHPHIRTFAH
jgi:hypothetical protein